VIRPSIHPAGNFIPAGQHIKRHPAQTRASYSQNTNFIKAGQMRLEQYGKSPDVP
jgi:hypothetical protein